MIFPRYKTIFIHTPRTGGTSFEHSLCFPLTRTDHEKQQGFWNKHLDARRAEFAWRERWNSTDWNIVTIWRDPLELVASQWIQKHWDDPEHLRVDNFRKWVRKSKILYPVSAEVDSHSPLPYMGEIYEFESAGASQKRFLESHTNPSIYFLRFERLQEDMKMFFDKIGCEYKHADIGKRPTLKYLPIASSGGIDYASMYDARSYKSARSKLSSDIEISSHIKEQFSSKELPHFCL